MRDVWNSVEYCRIALIPAFHFLLRKIIYKGYKGENNFVMM